MKRIANSVIGVTLLEVMLVLAIAAMIIVMSVRYYQSAVASQQANAMMEQLQAIIAAADGLAQATGSYSTVTQSALTPLLPGGTFYTPWGTQIVMSAQTFSTAVHIQVYGNIPTGVCPLLYEKLSTNNHWVNSSNALFNVSQCTAGSLNGVWIYYLANPS